MPAKMRDRVARFFCMVSVAFSGSLVEAQTVTATIPVGGSPAAIAVNPLTNRIYVTSVSGNTVTVIDGATHAKTTLPVGTNPRGLAVNTANNKIYTANEGSGNVSVIDGATHAVVNVATGAGPQAVAINPATGKVYVANTGADTVSILNGATNAVIATMPVGTNPCAIAVNPLNGFIFVANRGSGNVTVIDAATDLVTATIATGTTPSAIAVDATSGTTWVANYGGNTVSRINAVSKLGDRAVTAPSALAVNPVTKRVYVGSVDNHSLTLIDGLTAPPATIGALTAPQAFTIDPVTNRIYVANGTGSVAVIDGATNTVVGSVTAGSNTLAITVNPVTNRIYAANNVGASVTVIDGNAYTTTSVAPSAAPFDIAINPLNNKIYLAGFSGNMVTILNGNDNSTYAIAVGSGPRCIAVNPVTRRIYTGNYTGNTVTVIDGDTLATTTIPAGAAPVAIAVNPVTNRIYVANSNSNTVTVIDGANNTTTTVATGSTPSALAVNPVTNRIYVANFGGNTVTVIDGATNSASAVTVGSQPKAIAVNAVTNQIFTANYASDNVTRIDGGNHATTTIAAGSFPQAIAVNPASNKVYVANRSSGSATIINGADNSTTAVATGSVPSSIAINPLTNTIFVTNETSQTVTKIDGISNAATDIASGLASTIAVNVVTNRVYFIGGGFSTNVIAPAAATLSNHTTDAATPGGSLTTDPTPELAFAVSGDYAPNNPLVRGVYYRLGDAQGPFSLLSGSGPYGLLDVAGVLPGINYVLAFAVDAMEGTSVNAVANGSHGTSSMIGRPVVFPFVKIDTFITTPSPLPNATLRSSYSTALAAHGLTPFTYTLTGGALPGGYTLSPAGVISGSNDGFGATYNFTVMVTDGLGYTASKNFSLTLSAGGTFPMGIGLSFLPVPYTVGDNTLRLRASVSQSILPTVVDGKVRFLQGGNVIPGCESFDVNVGDIFPVTVDCMPPFVPPYYPTAVGSYGYTAEFSGSGGFGAASASATLVVNKASATVVVTGNGTSVFGDSVSLQTVVQGRPGYTPTGSVTFQAGGFDIAGCVALALDITGATCNTAALPPGANTITVVYAGDASFNAATSVAVTHTVYPAAAAIVSRKRHGGVDRDIPIVTGVPLSGTVSVEPRVIGAGHQIVFIFSGPVSPPGTASVTNAAGGTLAGVFATVAINPLDAREVIVTLTGVPDNTRASVNLAGPNNLPVTYSAPIGFLAGDVGGSRSVTAADISAVKANDGQPAGAANFRLDVNASGTIDAADRTLVKSQAGRALAP